MLALVGITPLPPLPASVMVTFATVPRQCAAAVARSLVSANACIRRVLDALVRRSKARVPIEGIDADQGVRKRFAAPYRSYFGITVP